MINAYDYESDDYVVVIDGDRLVWLNWLVWLLVSSRVAIVGSVSPVPTATRWRRLFGAATARANPSAMPVDSTLNCTG